VEKQLNKLIEVIKVTDHTEPHVEREMALVKVRTEGVEERLQIKEIVEAFRARAVDVGRRSAIYEVSGSPDKIEGFIEGLEPYGVLEVMRTGAVAMSRGENILRPRMKKEAV